MIVVIVSDCQLNRVHRMLGTISVGRAMSIQLSELKHFLSNDPNSCNSIYNIFSYFT